MYKSALRSSSRVASSLRQTTLSVGGRRFASTSPANTKRSWKSSLARWGLAAGAVYWYSTSAVFAEEPQPTTISPPPHFSDEDLPTVEAVVAQKRREAESRLQQAAAAHEPAPALKDVEATTQTPPKEGGPEDLEEEADQQGAFDPETGEINWDCPCLGGMAHGPCGEEFKAAFSCFVYSKEETKGIDCIDKFQGMQDCFRKHPEVYGDELGPDDDEALEGETPEAAVEAAKAERSSPEGGIASKAAEATSSAAEATATEKEGDLIAEGEKKAPPTKP
ncbi:hypothetical protein F4779DRAFT_590822 [Xylariaceae sp. FL0662B]|nr:hypothetical protein F4779DRAFT_590822 [Xylariaceae sp. FL0662B]